MSLLKPTGEERIDDMAESVRNLLESLGEDPDRDGLEETPRRVASALLELTDGYGRDPHEVVRGALYPHRGEDAVTVHGIPFYSLCEHHLLPMFGQCHIGYVPSGHVIGLSKLPRLVDLFSHRLQQQERMTRELAEAIEELLDARGVAVVLEARHLCMEMRGVQKAASETVTSCLLGTYLSDAQLRADFMSFAQRR